MINLMPLITFSAIAIQIKFVDIIHSVMANMIIFLKFRASVFTSFSTWLHETKSTVSLHIFIVGINPSMG